MAKQKKQNGKKTKPAQKIQRAHRRPQTSNKRRSAGVPACALKYAAARLDPFSKTAVGACLPQASSGPTFRFTTQARFQVQTSLTADGCLGISPSAANDQPSLWWKDSFPSSANFDYFVQGAPGDVTAHEAHGSPFQTTAFSPGNLEQRCLGWGVKIYSITAPLHKEGMMYGTTVTNDNLDTPTFIDAATQRPDDYMTVLNTRWADVSKGKLILLDRQVSPTAVEAWFPGAEYRGISKQMAGGSLSAGSRSPRDLIAFAKLPNANGERGLYFIEFVAHWEVRGSEILAISKPSETAGAGYTGLLSSISHQCRAMGVQYPAAATMVNNALSEFAKASGYGWLHQGLKLAYTAGGNRQGPLRITHGEL